MPKSITLPKEKIDMERALSLSISERARGRRERESERQRDNDGVCIQAQRPSYDETVSSRAFRSGKVIVHVKDTEPRILGSLRLLDIRTKSWTATSSLESNRKPSSKQVADRVKLQQLQTYTTLMKCHWSMCQIFWASISLCYVVHSAYARASAVRLTNLHFCILVTPPLSPDLETGRGLQTLAPPLRSAVCLARAAVDRGPEQEILRFTVAREKRSRNNRRTANEAKSQTSASH